MYKDDDLISKENLEKMSSDDESTIDQVERCFAYELYHNFSNILDCLKRLKPDSPLSKLVLNGEIPKEIIAENDGKYRSVYPDLVLHRGQGTIADQKLVCEIKRYFNTKGADYEKRIVNDLYKLSRYLELKRKSSTTNDIESASFETAVFMMTNCSRDKMYNQLKEILKKNMSVKKGDEINKKIEVIKNHHNIKCIYVNVNNEENVLEPGYFLLSDVIDNNKK